MAFFCSSNPFQLLSGSVSLFSTSNFFLNFMGILINRLCPGHFLFLKPLPIIEWFCQSFSYIQRFPEFYGHFNQQIVPRPFFCSSNLFWLLSGSVSLFYFSNFFLNFMGILINRLCPGHFFCSSNPFQLLSGSVSLFFISNFFLNFMGIFINRLCPGHFFVHQTPSNYWVVLLVFFSISYFFLNFMGILINRLCPGHFLFIKPLEWFCQSFFPYSTFSWILILVKLKLMSRKNTEFIDYGIA